MIWWAEDPVRSAEERTALAALAETSGWLRIVQLRLDGVHLCWDVNLKTAEREYPLTLRYPDHFPTRHPWYFRAVSMSVGLAINIRQVGSYAWNTAQTIGIAPSPARTCFEVLTDC